MEGTYKVVNDYALLGINIELFMELLLSNLVEQN